MLERTSRRVDLTRAGEAFLAEARRTLDAAGSARRAARRAAAGETGWLRIGFVDSAAYDLLPRLLVAFHHHRPEVRLQLQELSTEAQLAALGDDVDVSITRDTDPEHGVELTPLIDEPLVAAVDDGHRLADRDVADLAEFAADRAGVADPESGDERAGARLSGSRLAWQLRTRSPGLAVTLGR